TTTTGGATTTTGGTTPADQAVQQAAPGVLAEATAATDMGEVLGARRPEEQTAENARTGQTGDMPAGFHVPALLTALCAAWILIRTGHGKPLKAITVKESSSDGLEWITLD
ncbi:MAG: hypothetical protein IJR00_05320, partial [Lachnospiraceae bacterium]|nr:hypothetical protein [Lachnospiraceae bacterium]